MTTTPLVCPLCGSTSIREKPFKYVFLNRDLWAKECGRCGIIFIHPQPTPEELRNLYAAQYFEGGDFRCGHEGSYCDPSTLEHLSDQKFFLQIKALKPGGRLLEIGCAGGATLSVARELGFSVQGVEISEDASRIAREKYGLPVFTGDIIEARFPPESFDVIFMGDVIEHLPDPVTTLRELFRIMADGGLLVMALPSQTNTLSSRLGFLVYGALGRSATVALPPYHLFEYRPGSLCYLLRQCGFRIDRLDQGIIPPHQISLRGPAIQRIGKKLLQYPNWMLTQLFHVYGDRITVYATKQA
ncbi:MAG TPA: class I SAM-dependent methyltransferase [Bacteroidota bacterium]